MGKIWPIISEKVLEDLNPESSRITSDPARYEVGDLFEFNKGTVPAE
jgi:hypothetical protein